MHAGPLNTLARAETLANRLQHRRVRPDLRVTAHARFGGRNAGRSRLFNRRVTVSAVDPNAAHVMLVRERDRLFLNETLAGIVSGPVQPEEGRAQTSDRHRRDNDRGAGNRVGFARK